MSIKKLNENELGDISSGNDNLKEVLAIGSFVSSVVAGVNFFRNWKRSDKIGFRNKYKDSVDVNTWVPVMISTACYLAMGSV